MENLSGQRPGIDHRARVNTGTRAEHQVAHLITGGMTRAKPGSQQRRNQLFVLRTHAANLQVAAIGRLNHTTGITLSHVRHGHRLGSRD